MVQCQNCKYSLVKSDKRYCLRFPPVIRLQNPATVGHESMYPEVKDNYRCGEGEVEA